MNLLRSYLVRWLAITAALGVVAPSEGCSGESCELDTDCPLFQRCTQGRCQRLGIGGGRDAGGVDAGGFDAGNPDTGGPSTTLPVATIVASQSTIGGGTWSFSATFGLDAACQVTDIATCRVTDCVVPSAGGRSSMAGTLSLLDGLAAPVLSPGADGTYVAATGVGFLWDGSLGLPAPPGLRIQAVGAPSSRDIGPFTLMINGPPGIDVTAPDFGSPVTLSRAAPTDFQWSADVGAAVMALTLVGSEDLSATQRREVAVDCFFSGVAGTLPAGAVAPIPGATATYRMATRAVATRSVVEWSVAGRLETLATQQGGTAVAEGTVNLM